MQRFISPPKDELDQLRQSLTEGEKKVFEFFHKNLPIEWEIYLQPYMNGLRPDFVLLNPFTGIAVFEVKDWNLDAMEYYVRERPGRSPELMGCEHGQSFSKQDENPIYKIRLYKDEIKELYCPRLGRFAGEVVITAGVIFPFADDERVRELLLLSRAHHKMLANENLYPVSGRNALESGDLLSVFPNATWPFPTIMGDEHAQDLRNWLIEPMVAKEQREPLEFDENQKRLVTSRTKSGYRRIKGPAGSGKSQILAARAVELVLEGKQVLVVTFNITMLNYLGDLAVRWPPQRGSRRKDITWLHYHSWCKRVCKEADREESYKDLWRNQSEEYHDPYNDGSSDILDYQLPNLVSEILEASSNSSIQRYDAILVDEGQDFSQKWWDSLRKALKKNGEILLVADATQNAYGAVNRWQKGAWTDQSMLGTGFKGPWSKLKVSYRIPPKATLLARDYAVRYLPADIRDIPDEPQQGFDFYPCQLRWVQTSKEQVATVTIDEILNLFGEADPEILAIADTTFLVDTISAGREITAGLQARNIKVSHTFDEDEDKRRIQKFTFFKGAAQIKGTTLHSFKGWEARAIVICIRSAIGLEKLSLVYSGITRLQRHTKGSFLTVVCAEDKLAEYGRTWPDFRQT